MKFLKTGIGVSLIITFAFFGLATLAYAQNQQATLKQYIADLQKNPDNYALREKIIKHVRGMRPKPAITAEAERYEGRAEFAIKNAKSEADFLDAAKEYEKALLIAPWASVYYFNQGIAYEKAGKAREAKRSFEFYLIAAPNAQDAKAVRKRIAGLEYAMEKAADDTWLKKLNGVKYKLKGTWGCCIVEVILDIRDKEAVLGHKKIAWLPDSDCTEMRRLNPGLIGRFEEVARGIVSGRNFTVSLTNKRGQRDAIWEFHLSDDDQTITVTRLTGEKYAETPDEGEILRRE